jgi:hypothetical protein
MCKEIAHFALLPGAQFVLSFTLVLSFTDSETQPLGVDGAWGVSSDFCVIAPSLGETSGAGERGRMSGMSRVSGVCGIAAS